MFVGIKKNPQQTTTIDDRERSKKSWIMISWMNLKFLRLVHQKFLFIHLKIEKSQIHRLQTRSEAYTRAKERKKKSMLEKYYSKREQHNTTHSLLSSSTTTTDNVLSFRENLIQVEMRVKDERTK